MKAKIIKNQHLNTIYSITHKPPLVHGFMKYKCRSCGKTWTMNLEIGVEDFGKNGRPHQPCPFVIPCDCGGTANDISGCVPYPEIRELFSGQRYFAYDKSGKDNACGEMAIFIEKE
ncbi:MAG: hypothetical protein ACI4F5_06370 [Acutalibacteraceae bacterium]